jgi:hypothetical protein
VRELFHIDAGKAMGLIRDVKDGVPWETALRERYGFHPADLIVRVRGRLANREQK